MDRHDNHCPFCRLHSCNRRGFLYCLLGSDRPIHEVITPNFQDQRSALTTQFSGMSDEEFIDGFTEVKCEKPEEYDEFMEWTLPKFVENVNLFFGSEGQYDYFIGKTQTGIYVYNKCYIILLFYIY